MSEGDAPSQRKMRENTDNKFQILIKAGNKSGQVSYPDTNKQLFRRELSYIGGGRG